jgi:HK97 family phage major capsid protein
MDDEQTNDTVKTGARNNAEDRQRVRKARQHARETVALMDEIEPSESDDELMSFEERVNAAAQGKALRVKVRLPDGQVKAIERAPMGEAAKSLRPFEEYTDPGYKVLGVPFGGPLAGRDADGEAFHEGTELWLEPGQMVNLTYYHGFGPDDPWGTQNPPALIGRAKYMGKDERGGWFEPAYDPNEPLALRLMNTSPENIRSSSGAVGHLVRYGKANMIDVWPVGELALFDTNEWRQPANDYAVVEQKSAHGEPTQPDAVQANSDAATLPEETEPQENLSDESNKGDLPMDEKDIQAIVEATKAALVPAIDAAVDSKMKAMWDEAPSKLGGILTAKQAPAEMKTANLGDPDPVEDYWNYIVKGESRIKKHTVKAELPNGRGGTFKAALQEGADDEGGYLVPAGELGRIIEKRDEAALMPKLGVATFTTDRDVYNIPTEGTAMTKFTIVAEEGDISAAENEPTLGQAAVTLYNFTKLIKISNQLDEDYNSGLDTFLTGGIGRAWALTDNYYMQIGNGTTAPQGVFVGGTAGLTLDAAAAIGAAELPELVGKLKEAYLPGAAMIMKRTTKAYLAGLTGNQFVFSAPAGSNLMDSVSAKLGYPVWGTEDCAAIGAGLKSMLFGNFGLYGWVRNRSLRVQRLVELYAGNGQIGILATFRAGGKVLQAEALQYATHPTA